MSPGAPSGSDKRITYVHGTAVAVGEGAVLIRGRSGAGKSQLALALMSEARQQGLFTRLIGDDRLALSAAGDRVVVRGHPEVRGLIEERGTGILKVNEEHAGLVRCVVDLVEAGSRLPEPADQIILLQGVRIPVLVLLERGGPQEGARRILAFLERT